jgi:NAD(P)-dependent dehydrogenase (short-subunit alcohol dehydrogenase family)
VLFDRDENALSQTREALVADAEAIAIAGDVSDESDVGEIVQKTKAHFGRLDAVVANAGINGVWAPIENLMPSEWDETICINLRGTYLTLHKAVPLLKRAGGGAIVIVSSINGVHTFTNPGATAYSASKAAQVAMAQQLALELGKHRIRVNVVCPGAIDTTLSPALKSATARKRKCLSSGRRAASP